MSTDEFRLIHEDYQRARKGVSTLYADHFQALADSRRQLRIILAMPVLGLLGVVLGIPPQIDASRENLMTIAAYVVIIAIGLVLLRLPLSKLRLPERRLPNCDAESERVTLRSVAREANERLK